MTLSGVTVVDATRPLVLKITRADVDASIKGDPKHCAAAVACQRITGAQEVRIHKSRAYVKKGTKWTRYTVPAAIYREIVAFDRGAAFEPGEYRLIPPSPSSKLGQDAWRGPETRTGKHRSKNVRPQHITINVRPDSKRGSLLFESLS